MHVALFGVFTLNLISSVFNFPLSFIIILAGVRKSILHKLLLCYGQNLTLCL